MSTSPGNHYFLTGGTGDLGRELIPRLLGDDPSARITILIRASERDHLQRRLEATLRYVRYFHPAFCADRLEAIAGDTTRVRLGLARAEYQPLSRSVTHIIHAAASIDLSGSYAALRHNNLGGTRGVARLAEDCRKLRCFLLVSTAYVAGRRSGDVLEDELDRGQKFVNNYERSKFDSEMYVRSLAGRLPTVIVRPSIVVGDSRDGHAGSFQNMYLPLYYIGIGALANTPGDPTTLVDIVPINHVVDVIASVVDEPAAIDHAYHACGGEHNLVPFTFLVDAARVTLADRRMARERHRSLRRPHSSSPALAQRLAYLFRYLSRSKRFSTANLSRDLGDRTPQCPHPSTYVSTLMAFWRSTNFGQHMPWTVDGPPPKTTAKAHAVESSC